MQNENIGNFAYNLKNTQNFMVFLILSVRTVHLQKCCGLLKQHEKFYNFISHVVMLV